MKLFLRSFAIASIACLFTQPLFADDDFAAKNDVTWTTLGTNENDSMPIGNGDIAANVWTEQNGDIVLLIAKSDAWTELGKIVKLARVRVSLSPNPFAGSSNFSQTLRLEDGCIDLTNEGNLVRVWIDANHPVLHVESHLAQAATLEARMEMWRTNVHSMDQASPDRGGLFELGHSVPIKFTPDTLFPARSGHITWCHYNSNSIYPIVLTREHLESVVSKYPDPLLHRCFGATMSGPNLISDGDYALKSSMPGKNARLDVVALTTEDTASPEAWLKKVDALAAELNRGKLERAWDAHRKWWNEFWDRSWISVSGNEGAAKVSQGYIMQRWMVACSSRGPQPAKFNGGLFTVGHDGVPENRESNERNHNPDYRAWGNSYWNQNNRLLYWPLIASGDEDLLKPWFDLYLNSLPLVKDRTQIYFHHDGAAYIETMYFWGLPNLNDFGWDNSSTELQSSWMRFHTQGALEVVSQMLDSYDCTQDEGFARKSIVPFANELILYYEKHWQRGPDGKLRFSPTQSLETYQVDAVNPTPDIAALDSIIPRLLALPKSTTTQEERNRWQKVLADMPPIPMGKTVHGKIPRAGMTNAPGTTTVILPAEKYGKTSNGENPELYTAFPYRIYGVGKPDLKLARDTYAARLFPQDTCWGQDGTQSAVLGLTDEARKAATAEFTNYGNQRFPWFWKAGHDWIPDLDNGGSGMITLQLMLMQCDGRRIQLLPAWPANWTADFKLHAPFQTTVEGHVQNGQISNLKVVPASRTKDVVIVPAS
jgi:hypothetical protein